VPILNVSVRQSKSFAGAIAQFTDAKSTIWASAYDKSFLEGPDQLPTSSLCRFIGIETPTYRITNWADDNQAVTHQGIDLGLQILHTPGHTPDELAVWDASERTLFVGDTLYEWAAISFPTEGNLKDYSTSIARLQKLVKGWNADETLSRVKIACGHVTSAADAGEILAEVDTFLYHVVQGWIEPSNAIVFRDETLQRFEREDGRFGFQGPKSVFDDFKADPQAMALIEARQAQ
jgi:glyoxylase-like metal-dependent hydrolase (beta-lactamase superfamily II)